MSPSSAFRTCHGLYQSKCGIGGPVHIAVGALGSNSNCRSFLHLSLDRKHLSKSEDSHVVRSTVLPHCTGSSLQMWMEKFSKMCGFIMMGVSRAP